MSSDDLLIWYQQELCRTRELLIKEIQDGRKVRAEINELKARHSLHTDSVCIKNDSPQIDDKNCVCNQITN